MGQFKIKQRDAVNEKSIVEETEIKERKTELTIELLQDRIAYYEQQKILFDKRINELKEKITDIRKLFTL